MPLASGMAAQIAFKAETAYGTYAAPDRCFPLVDESMKKEPKRLESEGIISGARVLRSQQWAPGDIDVAGGVGLELYDRSIGLLLKWCFGQVVTAGAGPFTHTFTPGDLADDFFTMQIGKPDRTGVVRPFSYLGCMVKSWEIACKAGEIATLGLDVVAQDVVTSQALVANTLAAGIKPMTYIGGSVSIGGTATKVREMSLSGDNALAIDDRRFLGSGLIDQPLEAGLRPIKGSLECDFADLTQYDRLVNGNEFALVWTLAAGAQTLVTTLNVRYDDANPNVEGKDVLKTKIPFVAVGPTSDAGAITSVFTTTEAAP